MHDQRMHGLCSCSARRRTCRHAPEIREWHIGHAAGVAGSLSSLVGPARVTRVHSTSFSLRRIACKCSIFMLQPFCPSVCPSVSLSLSLSVVTKQHCTAEHQHSLLLNINFKSIIRTCSIELPMILNDIE